MAPHMKGMQAKDVDRIADWLPWSPTFTSLAQQNGSSDQATVVYPQPLLTDIVFDKDGRGVEHLHALYRPDRYTFEMEMERAGSGGARRWTPVAKRARSKTPGKRTSGNKTSSQKTPRTQKPRRKISR